MTGISNASGSVFDYSREIREGGLKARQVLVLLILGLLVLFDGMDNQLLGLIAHDMSEDLGLPISAFGLIFSSALVGGIAGALLLSTAADQSLGRKRVIIIGMGLAGFGTFMTAHAETLIELIGVRFVTGIGLGAALPILISLASEFSPQRYSRLVVSLMIAFVPLGSLLGSVMARGILPYSGWHGLLYVAGCGTIALTLLAAFVVPESVAFLVNRKRNQPAAVKSIQKLFGVNGVGAVVVDQERDAHAISKKLPVAMLFDKKLRALTILVWIAFFMDQAILYFVMNWTPSLLLKAGMSSSAGTDAAAMFGIGGALGTIAQGWLTTRFGIYKVMIVEICIYVAAMVALPSVLDRPEMASAMVFAIAATICAYHAGLINLTLESFPESIRSTAFGWAFGMGRMGAAGAPAIAGVFLGWGWSPALIFLWAAMLGVATGLALLGMRKILSRRSAQQDAGQDAAVGLA